jgi:hypothetical protein
MFAHTIICIIIIVTKILLFYTQTDQDSFYASFFESSHSSVGKILEKNYGNMFTKQSLILQLCQALRLSDSNQLYDIAIAVGLS